MARVKAKESLDTQGRKLGYLGLYMSEIKCLWKLCEVSVPKDKSFGSEGKRESVIAYNPLLGTDGRALGSISRTSDFDPKGLVYR